MLYCTVPLSRDGTEELLMKEESGSFLVRQSRSEDYRYDLCVRSEHGIQNVRIMQTDSQEFCITEDQTFNSLTQLIKHYGNHVRRMHTVTHTLTFCGGSFVSSALLLPFPPPQRGMPAALKWNYCPSLVSTPIPNISSREWEFEPADSRDGDPPLAPIPGVWDANWRESVSFSDNCECTRGAEGREGRRSHTTHCLLLVMNLYPTSPPIPPSPHC